jgi:hypothetical protein
MSRPPSHPRFFWAYQFAAVWLLLLVSLPFTAPWASYDMAHDLTHRVLQSAPDESCDAVKDTLTHDSGMAATFVTLAPATFRSPVVIRTRSENTEQMLAARQPVPLRL